MWLRNFMIWKKKSKILMINKLYTKQCCLFFKCRKNAESKNPNVVITKNGRKMLL